jgi:uracil-DNA glycosylase family 4
MVRVIPTRTSWWYSTPPEVFEEEVGSHLVGRSGQFVQAILSEYGARMEDIWVTSAVRCRPPGDRGPEVSEIDACNDWLANRSR